MKEFIEAGADPYELDEHGRNAVFYATCVAPEKIDLLAPLLEKIRLRKDAYVRASLTKDNEEAGYEEKYNKGMAKGIEIGVEKTATNMLQAGFDLKVIASVTGLSESQIQKLKNSH